MAANPALELDRICRRYGPVIAVDDVSLAVSQGEFLTLLGPSGSGKTSTLRLIGGFEKLDRGQVRVDGVRVDHLPPYQRDTATIFQSGALFPHKSVAENIAYGLRMRGMARADIGQRLKEVLDIVRLAGYEDRYPNQLSGGQKQRVALARSLAVRPAILLFDEPLSALDLSLRLQLRGEIKRLHDELGFSAIYVTHDQGEAMAMSDRIAVMNKGRVEQIDTPEAIYYRPASEFIYNFIGESCCLPVRIEAATVRDETGAAVALELGSGPGDGTWRLYVRQLKFGAAALVCQNRLKARVSFVEFLGSTYRYHLKAGAIELFCDHVGKAGLTVGDEAVVGWDEADMAVFA